MKHCPKCNSPMPPDELRCIRCGFQSPAEIEPERKLISDSKENNLGYLVNGIVEMWKAASVRKQIPQPEGKALKAIPPAPAGWNRTMADLWAEMEAGVRKSIEHPEMDWAIDYERRTAPPPPPESVKDKWESAARKRNCYCSIWGINPAKLEKDELPEGFCGICERCGEYGHTRHFPGPIPYTGAWCDKCYRVLKWTWPFRSLSGWGYILAVVMIASFVGRIVVIAFERALK